MLRAGEVVSSQKVSASGILGSFHTLDESTQVAKVLAQTGNNSVFESDLANILAFLGLLHH